MNDEGLKELAAREAGAVEPVNKKVTKVFSRARKRDRIDTNKICDLIAQGHSKESACRRVGITNKTLWTWTKDDEELREKVSQAVAKSEISLVNKVLNKATDDWKAAAYLLERRFPERYAPKAELSIDVNKSDGLEQVVAMFEQTNDLIDIEPDE